MSMFDDGGMGSIYRPLKQSLLPQAPPPQIMPGMDNPATRMQTANGMRGRGGQTATPQAGPGGRGPASNSIYKSLMLKQAGVGEDEKDYHELAHDPHTTPQMLHQLLAMRPKMAAPAPEQQAQHEPGSIEISQGRGPNAMSEQNMAQWMQQAKRGAPSGEQISEIREPVPGLGVIENGHAVQGTKPVGFKVSNIAPPQQQAQPQTLEQQKASRQAQLDEQKATHQKEIETRQNRREDETDKQHQIENNKLLLTENQRRQKEFQAQYLNPETGGRKHDAGVVKDWNALKSEEQDITSRLNSMISPQPQQQGQPQLPTPPKPGHPLDPGGAQHFLQAAGGDKNKARALAKQAGWSF